MTAHQDTHTHTHCVNAVLMTHSFSLTVTGRHSPEVAEVRTSPWHFWMAWESVASCRALTCGWVWRTCVKVKCERWDSKLYQLHNPRNWIKKDYLRWVFLLSEGGLISLQRGCNDGFLAAHRCGREGRILQVVSVLLGPHVEELKPY